MLIGINNLEIQSKLIILSWFSTKFCHHWDLCDFVQKWKACMLFLYFISRFWEYLTFAACKKSVDFCIWILYLCSVMHAWRNFYWYFWTFANHLNHFRIAMTTLIQIFSKNIAPTHNSLYWQRKLFQLGFFNFISSQFVSLWFQGPFKVYETMVGLRAVHGIHEQKQKLHNLTWKTFCKCAIKHTLTGFLLQLHNTYPPYTLLLTCTL